MIHEEYRSSSNTALCKITSDITSYHTTVEATAKIASEADTKYLILYHIFPPLPASQILHTIFPGDAKRYDSEPIAVGVDDMMISLPSDGTQIKVSNLFR